MSKTVSDLIRDLDNACESVQEQVVTPMPDGSYQFEIADHGVHAYLTLQDIPSGMSKQAAFQWQGIYRPGRS